MTDKGHAFIPCQTFTESPSSFSPGSIDSYEHTSTLATLVSCRNSLFVVFFCWSVDWLRAHCVDCVLVVGRSRSSWDGTGRALR